MRLLAFAAMVLASYGLAPMGVAAANETNEVPFKLYRGYVIVARGSIGNLRNLNFLIDTGAVPSVLDRRIAKKLHLTGSFEKLSLFTNELEAQRVIAPEVSLGPFHADALPAVVGNLSFAEKNLGIQVDAVIGLDLLNQSAFTIDYGARKITVGPIDLSLERIPYEAHAGYAVVEMKIGQRNLGLLVDTGASELMLFEGATRGCPEAVTSVGTRTGSNMGGEIRVQEVRLAQAYLGSMAWGTRHVFMMTEGGERQPDGLRGLLGVASLNARRVGFDPEHKIFAWDMQGGSAQLPGEARR